MNNRPDTVLGYKTYMANPVLAILMLGLGRPKRNRGPKAPVLSLHSTRQIDRQTYFSSM